MRETCRWWIVAGLLPAVLFFCTPAFAEEQSYVLTAGKWGAKQDRAVAVAGGLVTFSHRDSGIGVAASDAPDFLERAMASGAFSHGDEDRVFQWQPPGREYAVSEAGISPEDETFFAYQWNMQAMEAPAAWQAGCTGAGVRVAILDGGVDRMHGDLAPNIDDAWSRSFVPGLEYYEDSGSWHGSHVAGIVAAADNGFGVIGVAPEATLVAVKVLDAGTGSFSWLLRGILYASTPMSEGGAGADIINMSLGAVVLKEKSGLFVAAMNKAVNHATQNGTLVISAAGNLGFNFDHSWNFVYMPAEAGNGIAISATGPVGFAYGGDDLRRFAHYSNHGHSLVHVAAPGGDWILYPNDPAWYRDMVISSTYYDPGTGSHWFTWAAGTSMAAPAAAGVAALIKQRDPGISVGALKNRLARTADDEGEPGHDVQYGRGFVNARKACVQKTTGPPARPARGAARR